MPPPQRNIRNPHPCTRCRQHHIRCVMQDSGVCRKCARMKAPCTFGDFADTNESASTRSSTPAGNHERRGSSASSSHMKKSFDNYGGSYHSHPYRTSGSPPSRPNSELYPTKGLHSVYGSQGSADSLEGFYDPRSISPSSRYWDPRTDYTSGVQSYIDSSAASSLHNLDWDPANFPRRGSQSSDWSDDQALWNPEMGIGTQPPLQPQVGYGYLDTAEPPLPLASLGSGSPPMGYRTKLMPNSCICFQSREGQCFCQPSSHCGCLTGPYFDRHCYNTPTL